MQSPHREQSKRAHVHGWIRALIACVLVASGLLACRPTTQVGVDATVDGSPIVDSPTFNEVPLPRPDARTDVVAPSRDGGVSMIEFLGETQVRLHPWESAAPSRTQCLGRPSTGPAMYLNFAGYSCRSGDWYYTQNYGEVERTSLRQNISQVLVLGSLDRPNDGTTANLACLPNGFALRLTTIRPRNPPTFPGEIEADQVVIAVFSNDLAVPGRIIWTEPATAQPPGNQIAASDRMIAWDIQRRGQERALMVSDQNGENIREIARGSEGTDFDELMADGPNLIWSAYGLDIYHWNADSRVVTNLTNDFGTQWSAFISGNNIVWLDQSHNLAGDRGHPNNPEVVLYNLQTRERRRITNDPENQPVGQSYPSIVGDWVLWADFRNAVNPNQRFRFTDRMELYGYHIPTGVTQPVLEGNIRVGLSRGFDDGQIRVNCSDDASGNLPLAIALPIPTPMVRDQ